MRSPDLHSGSAGASWRSASAANATTPAGSMATTESSGTDATGKSRKAEPGLSGKAADSSRYTTSAGVWIDSVALFIWSMMLSSALPASPACVSVSLTEKLIGKAKAPARSGR